MFKFSMYISLFFVFLGLISASKRQNKVYVDEFGIRYTVDEYGNQYIVDQYGRPVAKHNPSHDSYEEMGIYDNRKAYSRY